MYPMSLSYARSQACHGKMSECHLTEMLICIAVGGGKTPTFSCLNGIYGYMPYSAINELLTIIIAITQANHA